MNKENEQDVLNKCSELVIQETKNDTLANKEKEKTFKLKGFFYVMFAATFGSFQHYFMLKATFFNAVEQTVIRYIFQLIMMIIIAKFCKVNLTGPEGQRKTLIIRGIDLEIVI